MTIRLFLKARITTPRDGSADELASKPQQADNGGLKLQMISNRGVKVWPEGFPETFCTDHWRGRFFGSGDAEPLSNRDVVELLNRVQGLELDFVKTEHLYDFDGQPGYSLGQGQ
jgi:isocitrate dehydrogenase